MYAGCLLGERGRKFMKGKAAILFVGTILAIGALACDTSGAPTESPKIHTATPAFVATTAAPAPTSGVVTAQTAATSAATTAATIAATATTAPTASPVPQAFLGDVVEQGGYSISAIQVEDPATPGLMYQKQEGKRLVAVLLAVGNVSADPLSVNPFEVTLLDKDGFAYQTDLGSRDGQLQLVTLAVGQRVRGWVAYQIPQAAVVSKVRYSVGSSSSVVLEAGLDKAPAGHSPTTGTPRNAPKLSKLGDVVEQGGYSISPSTLEDPAKTSQFYQKQMDTRLVAVEVVLANVSGAKISRNPLAFYIVDTDGFVYAAALGGRDGQLSLIDIGPSDKVKGWVAFEIPTKAALESIEFLPGMFSGLAINAGLSK
jgi:hypothetical protein